MMPDDIDDIEEVGATIKDPRGQAHNGVLHLPTIAENDPRVARMAAARVAVGKMVQEELARSGFGSDEKYDFAKIIEPAFWTGEVPTKADLFAIGFDAPGPNWWMSKSAFRPISGHYMIRDIFVGNYTFAIPSREALEFITKHSRSILEVGSGTGFWAHLLRKSGVNDLIATDPCNPQEGNGQPYARFTPVELLTAVEAVKKYPTRDVLSVWPSYNGHWLYEAVCAMEPGRLLFYIGEGNGGCTGDDALHHVLWDERFMEEVDHLPMVQFTGLHDDLHVFRKRDWTGLDPTLPPEPADDADE